MQFTFYTFCLITTANQWMNEWTGRAIFLVGETKLKAKCTSSNLEGYDIKLETEIHKINKTTIDW